MMNSQIVCTVLLGCMIFNWHYRHAMATNLTDILSSYNFSETRLEFTGLNIETVPQDIFVNFSSLTVLKLGDNVITKVEGCPYFGPPILEKVDYGGNDLTSFPDFCCVGTSLTYINLNSNDIKHLWRNSTSCLIVLQTLYVAANGMITIDGLGELKGTIQSLQLHSNKFTDFGDVLTGASLLYWMSLGYSPDVSLTPSDLNGTRLGTLMMGYNSLTAFPDVYVLKDTLQHLLLPHNSISTLDKDLFSKLPNLKTLTLKGNDIECMSEPPRQFVSAMNSLSLVNNPIFCNCSCWQWALDPFWSTILTGKCSTPASLAGTDIVSLSNGALGCESTTLSFSQIETSSVALTTSSSQGTTCPATTYYSNTYVFTSRIPSSVDTTVDETSPIETTAANTTPVEQLGSTINYPRWSSWLPWGKCSNTCNGGIKHRFRVCLSKNSTIALDPFCTQNLTQDHNNNIQLAYGREESGCNEFPCPQNRQWTEWDAWGNCSSSCGHGTRVRTRTCDPVKPITGGRLLKCLGSEYEYNVCEEYTANCEAEQDADEETEEEPMYTESDSRPSAIAVGTMAIIFMVLIGVLMLLVDLIGIIQRIMDVKNKSEQKPLKGPLPSSFDPIAVDALHNKNPASVGSFLSLEMTMNRTTRFHFSSPTATSTATITSCETDVSLVHVSTPKHLNDF